MADTTSHPSLLHAAVQDLLAGKRDAAARLPGIAELAGPALNRLLHAEAARAADQAARLTAAGVNPSGPINLWMKGILDDAERDGRMTATGVLLDVALVGAVRKAKAAEIVSSETAIALADRLGDDTLRAAVAANRAEEIDSDHALKALLGDLTD